MSCTTSTANCAPSPWHTSHVSTGPVGLCHVLSAAWPYVDARSWHVKHARADGTVQARLTQLPPEHACPTPHCALDEHLLPASAWHFTHERMSSENSPSNWFTPSRKPMTTSLPGARVFDCSA